MAESRRRMDSGAVFLWALYILAIPIFVLYGMTLGGCTSALPGVPNIFLASIRAHDEPEVRVGYFGICVIQNATDACSSTTYSSSAVALGSKLQLPSKSNFLLQISLDIQSRLLLCVNTSAAILFLFGVLQLLGTAGLGKGRKQPGYLLRWRQISQQCLLLSTTVALVAAVSVAQAGNSLEYATTLPQNPRVITIRAGKTLQILQWLIVAFSILYAGILTMRSKKNQSSPMSKRQSFSPPRSPMSTRSRSPPSSPIPF